MSKRRHELTDEEWKQVDPLLPVQKPKTGKPNHDHRTVLNGIIWIVGTAAPWRDLPERYGKWQTVSSRFYRWQKAGIWQAVFAQLQQQRASGCNSYLKPVYLPNRDTTSRSERSAVYSSKSRDLQ